MGEARTALLSDNDAPTQDELNAAHAADGEAFFAGGTDPAQAPIKEHREAHAPGGEYANDADGDDTVDAPVGEYDEWQGSELRDELRRRELPVSGTNDELRQRLTDDDNVPDVAPE